MIPDLIQLAFEDDDVKPGWIALLIVVALAVATYFLWRSMNKQMRKIQIPPSGVGPTDPSPLGDDDDRESPSSR